MRRRRVGRRQLGRRRFLGTAGAVGTTALAGCTGLFDIKQRAFAAPPLVKNRPDAVYYPTHVEQMRMSGMQTKKGLTCALTYTYPHRFWLVTGTHTKEVKIQPKDSVHLMPVVWDAETGVVATDANPQVTVSHSADEVTSFTPWPMLSQPMGYHFGDNVQLPKNDTYDVAVQIGNPSVERTGSLSDAPERVSFSFSLKYDRESLEQIPWHKLPDKKGKRGAVPHMDMKKLPSCTAPKPNALPGQVVGHAKSGDAVFYAAVVGDASRFGGSSDQSYLAVSPRSPYDRYVLPSMSLSATLKRGSKTVAHGPLTQTLDPKLSLHYGTPVSSVEAGDKLTLSVGSPPNFARHEGYETAFLKMPSMTLTVPSSFGSNADVSA